MIRGINSNRSIRGKQEKINHFLWRSLQSNTYVLHESDSYNTYSATITSLSGVSK